MSKPYPHVGTKGIFLLVAPFDQRISEATVYTCAAARTFKDIENQGGDVYSRYYVIEQLPRETYERDLRNNEVILTLLSDSTSPVYVPSSFVKAFPSPDQVAYHRVICSIDLGMLPDGKDLSFLKKQLATVTSEVIGVEPQVFENAGPADGIVTQEQHTALTANREAAIKRRTTDHSRNLALESENEQLRRTNKLLADRLRKAGLLNT